MRTDAARYENLRMTVWMGMLIGLLNAGGLPFTVHRLGRPAALVLFAFLLLSAVRRRLVSKLTAWMTFPVF